MMKECLRYWSRLEGKGKYGCLCVLILSIIFPSNIVGVIACVYDINAISNSMFSDHSKKGNPVLTLSLPMSRSTLWDVRMWMVTGIYLVYGFLLCIRIEKEDRPLGLLQMLCIYVFAHMVCGISLRKKEWYLLSATPAICFLMLILSCAIFEQMEQLLANLEHNVTFLCSLGILDLGLLVLDIHTWRKERRIFVEGDAGGEKMYFLSEDVGS